MMFKRNKKSLLNSKSGALLVSAILLVCAVAGGVVMFLMDTSEVANNTFVPAQVTSAVVEELNDNVKEDVKIQNTGNIDAYIRATYVVTWKDEAGNVYGGSKPVAGVDYTITTNVVTKPTSDGCWILAQDGFYYWTEKVSPDAMTGILIDCCEYKANAPEGYHLAVEILGSAIQGVPESVVVDNWDSGVSAVNDDAELVVKQ